MRKRIYILALVVALLLAGCGGPAGQTTGSGAPSPAPATPTAFVIPIPTTAIPTQTLAATLPATTPSATLSPAPTETITPIPVIRFAVIGDYGGGGSPEADVARLVDSWQVDFLITTGDNNYPDGSAKTIDKNIGQFYQAYISPYTGKFGAGAEQNRFFPTLGNHDWNTDEAQPYLDYFTLPGNERYYDFTWGAVHFFALDSDSREPDGMNRSSAQAAWLQAQLASSTSPWNVVYLHHAPYSSGRHGPTDWAQWPYKEWGADAVLAGHDHTYERLQVDDLVYFVNGLGGGSIYPFLMIEDGSQVRYNDDYGAMRVEASPTQMTFQFINRSGELIDTYTLDR
jgi:tartrate-resistant acid phosphatase type 5